MVDLYPASFDPGEPTAIPKPSERSSWVTVLVDGVGVQTPLTYQQPEDFTLQPGDVVTVPFGSHQVGGIVLQWVDHLPEGLTPEQVKPVLDLVCSGFFPPDYWQMLEQVAHYYYTPLMAVLRTALPPGVLGKSQRRIRLQPHAISPDTLLTLSPRARQVLETLQSSASGDYSWRYLQRQVPGARTGLRDLLKRGWVESYLEPPKPPQPKQQTWVSLGGVVDIGCLTAKQQQVIRSLQQAGGELPQGDVLKLAQVGAGVLKTLENKGAVILSQREQWRGDTGCWLGRDQPKVLTLDQAQALQGIVAIPPGIAQTLVLHGVTGSGKTEVYLQAIAPQLEAGRSALVLVPEIGLTPQLTDRFRQRFGEQVLVYHSGLSVGERYDTWRQMLLGLPLVVIGTRSAVFSPLPHLGLIVLDEEHDPSFKQDQPMPCYHARTVAQWRSSLAHCPLILGSATPALDTYGPILDPTLATPSPPILLALPQRIESRPHPPIAVVDMRQELQRGNRSLFSHDLREAIVAMKAKGQQGILFVPRRGHSTFVSCRSCGEPLDCPHCDVSFTYHHPLGDRGNPFHPELEDSPHPPLLRCHYCNFSQPQPRHCPHCGSPYLKFFGSGTQRVTAELAEHFPDLRWIRFDSDTTRRKGAHRHLLDRFSQGDADLLVGTQMLTKGIDLPQVTLVGVLAADGLLHLPDFRAEERACQMLLQVAGRSGRGLDPGHVIIQTYSPDHGVIQAVKDQRYSDFLRQQLQERSPLQYPPFSQLILLRLSGEVPQQVEQTAETLALTLGKILPPEVDILGPAPAPILKIARRYRWHVLLKVKPSAPPSLKLPQVLLDDLCPGGVSLTIDVDPLYLL